MKKQYTYYTIEEVNSRHYGALLALRTLMNDEDGAKAPGAELSDQAYLHELKQRLEATDAYVRWVWAEGQLIGFFDADSYRPTKHDAYVRYMYVVPEVRRHGVASQMLEDFEETLKPDIPITLTVAPGNKAARSFYAKHGFVEMPGTFKDYRMIKYRKQEEA